MQITTVCPQCGKTYEVEGEYEGAEVQCESCGGQFVVERIASAKAPQTRRRGKFTYLVPWLVLFAIQGVGFLVGWLLTELIDALVITFMVDETWIITSVQVLLAFLCTSVASYLAFSHLIVKMIAKRMAKE